MKLRYVALEVDGEKYEAFAFADGRISIYVGFHRVELPAQVVAEISELLRGEQ